MIKSKYFIVCFFFTSILFVFSCQKELSCEDCIGNKPPIAIAGPDQLIVVPADSVSLDASSSNDPDGIIASYKWAKISGPATSSIISSDSALTVVKSLLLGVYQFELTVKDNEGLSAKDTVMVVVDDFGNLPPIPNAGADRSITLPVDSVLLNGDLSVDPDGTITTYQWTKISGPTTFRIVSSGSVQTKVDQLVQGFYEFQLMVTDNGGLSANDTVIISVNPAAGNISPISRAGNDTSINFDLHTCTIPASFRLDGRASTDPDGTIVSYRWTEWRPGTVVNPDSAVTEVKDLLMGVNRFKLTVTDNQGSTHQDEVVVNVVSMMNRPTLLAQLVSVGWLSEGRTAIATASAGNKIVFAGGRPLNPLLPASSKVDIYDVITGIWSNGQLSEGRISIGSAVLGNKIYLAGGGITKPNSSGSYEYFNSSTSTSSKVDIYDVVANTWSTTQLSSPHAPTGASVGNKIVFAGGDDVNPSSVADVYNAATNSWSSFTLSASRHISQAAPHSNNKIFFGGGSRDFVNANGPIYKNIDVYDAATNTWAVEMLSSERGRGAAIGFNHRIRWGGGFINNGYFDETHTVEIKSLADNSTNFSCLCEARGEVTVAKRGDFIVFFGGNSKNTFDGMDMASGTWFIGFLPANVEAMNGSIISHNNKLYVYNLKINGAISSEVFRLDF